MNKSAPHRVSATMKQRKSARPARLLLHAGELGADLVGVRMINVVVDGQRLLPGLPGLRQFAGGVARVAEVCQDICLVGAVAVMPGLVEREFEMGGGLGEVASMKRDVTEGVPNAILDVEPAELGDKP